MIKRNPHLIVPEGTKIVTRAEVHGHDGRLLHPKGALGMVVETPADSTHGYEKDKVADARRAVMASIDRGVPVQYGSEEDGIIVGYQKHGDEWICYHPLHDGGKKTFVETEWPWGITIYTQPPDPQPNQHDLQIASLRQAVAMATAKEVDNNYVEYAAWDASIARLHTLEKADDKTRLGEMQGNAWIYECLAHYRGAAARYLRAIAGDYPPAVTRHCNTPPTSMPRCPVQCSPMQPMPLTMSPLTPGCSNQASNGRRRRFKGRLSVCNKRSRWRSRPLERFG